LFCHGRAKGRRPSSPNLSRPFTSCFDRRKKDVDARVKPAHDD
jgi:hypothetical protein